MIEGPISRDFTVAVFVVHRDHVVLHRHAKLGMWLPPGGHIERDELPDEAAIREVIEETGIAVELIGERGIGIDYPDQPIQLVRPEGIQLEVIADDHQHIDLIYFARPVGATDRLPDLLDGMAWIASDALDRLTLTSEVRDWSHKAFAAARQW
jgi:8-oxo-dGTP pyrophosphatase MutT (NUDIX family)